MHPEKSFTGAVLDAGWLNAIVGPLSFFSFVRTPNNSSSLWVFARPARPSRFSPSTRCSSRTHLFGALPIMKRWLATAGLLALFLPASRAAAQAETGRITGTVTAIDGGAPLTGARVFVVGSRLTAETNAQGHYTLTVAPGTYRLRVSAIGYTPTLMDSVPVTANQPTTANFQLKHQTVELEKVVVVGYGTQAKRDVTGAVGSVSAEQIAQQPTTNVVEAIKGKVPGVDIISTGYKPGDGIQIRIRGTRSLKASNDPLYVLDGVPMAGSIGDLNPSDIESIEILKDASATAIYGSRGANGVVLVTTKKGNSSGRTRVTYDTYAATQQATKKINVFDGPAFLEYKREAWRTAGLYNAASCGAGVPSCPSADAAASGMLYSQELAAAQAGVSTDWQDLIRRNGTQISHQLAIAGGNGTTNYAASGNLMRQTGIVLSQDYDRKTLRVNVESQAVPRLRLGGSAMVVRSTQNLGRGDALYSETLADSPLSMVHDTTTGNLLFKPTPDPQRDNPLSDVANWIDERVRTRLFGTLTGAATLADGLEYHVNFGPDITYGRLGLFKGAETNDQQGSPAMAQLKNERTVDYTLDNILSYRRALGADHKIDLTALYSVEKNSFENDSIRAGNLPYESQRFFNLGSAGTVSAIGSQITQWVLQSYMGRLNYTFRDRYLLTLTGRMDGSSRLAEGHKYNFFPSVALGWRVIDEAFGPPVGPLNSLKLRASYGKTGNTAVDPYQTLGGLIRTAYTWGSLSAYGFRPNTLANPNLAWETTGQLDGGADFSLWGSRISGTLDLYRANTDQLLMNRQLPTSTGFSSVTQNIGSTRNTGIELALSAVTLDGWRGLRWTNDVSFSANKNEIVSLSNGAVDDVGNRWFIGQPINSTTDNCSRDCVWYDYRFLGIWQTSEAAQAATYGETPGQIKVEDVNGDGKINELDRQILGNTYPKWTGSINSRLDYGRIDFSVQLITRQGFMIANTFRTSQSTMAGRYNGIAVDYWTPTNPSNTDPRPYKNQEDPLYGSSRAYEDGSFTRVRNITLGFAVPERYMAPVGAQSLRLYATAQNPFTFTTSTTLDPEGRASAGVPAYRTLLLGANVGF
jgi:TonB-linked SusC/RagA family outer membrane protein